MLQPVGTPTIATLYPRHELPQREIQTECQFCQNTERRLLFAHFDKRDVRAIQFALVGQGFLTQPQLAAPDLDLSGKRFNQ